MLGVKLRAGFSLLESLVAIAVLAVLVAVAGLSSQGGWSADRDEPVPAVAALVAARREALRTGSAVTFRISLEGEPLVLTAMPDGSVLGSESIGFDVLSGRINERARPSRAGVESAWDGR